ncbi:GNAT family N-acetyltransferase [Clostridium paraputrificum]|uniref:GNAT family N-acetyltransferase n=1 Tax=Clostridium paraputrificum TaxID=29363 RepID=UPI003D327C11
MNIRRYKSEDCKEIIELFYNTVHSVNSKDYNEKQIEVWAPKEFNILGWDKSLSEHFSVVVEENNIIVGFGDLHFSGYLDRLYVHKHYQGKGIATRIVNEIEKYAKESMIKIITTHASITAKSFFEGKGYKVIKEQTVKRKDQYLINFIMEKIIR